MLQTKPASLDQFQRIDVAGDRVGAYGTVHYPTPVSRDGVGCLKTNT